MLTSRHLLLTLALAAAASVASVASGAEAVDPAKLFNRACGPCHGQDGRGQAKLAKVFGKVPQDLTSPAVQQRSDAELMKVVREGRGKMPAFGSRMPAEELTAILGHLRGLAAGGGAPKPAALPAARTSTSPVPVPTQGSARARGAAVFAVRCVKCHAPDASGVPALAAGLGLDPARIDLTDPSTRARKRQELRTTILQGRGRMPGFSGRLGDAEVDEAIEYLFGPTLGTNP